MSFFNRPKTQTAAPLQPVPLDSNADALSAMQRGIAEATPGNKKAPAPSAAAAAPIAPAFQTLAGAKNAPKMMVIPEDWAGIPAQVRKHFEAAGGAAHGMYFPVETPSMKKQREALEAEGAHGFYTPTEAEVYIAPGLTPTQEKFAAYHEVAGHHGLQGAMGDDYIAIMTRAMENPTVAELTRAMRDRSSNYEGGEDMSAAEEALSELAAAQRTGDYDLIERDWGVKVPSSSRPGLRGALGRAVQLTKRKLADLTGDEPEAFDDEQVHQLIQDAWRHVKRGRPKTEGAKKAELAAAMQQGINEASTKRRAEKRMGTQPPPPPPRKAAESPLDPPLGDW